MVEMQNTLHPQAHVSVKSTLSEIIAPSFSADVLVGATTSLSIFEITPSWNRQDPWFFQMLSSFFRLPEFI